jgi:hypothetical protein
MRTPLASSVPLESIAVDLEDPWKTKSRFFNGFADSPTAMPVTGI